MKRDCSYFYRGVRTSVNTRVWGRTVKLDDRLTIRLWKHPDEEQTCEENRADIWTKAQATSGRKITGLTWKKVEGDILT